MSVIRSKPFGDNGRYCICLFILCVLSACSHFERPIYKENSFFVDAHASVSEEKSNLAKTIYCNHSEMEALLKTLADASGDTCVIVDSGITQPESIRAASFARSSLSAQRFIIIESGMWHISECLKGYLDLLLLPHFLPLNRLTLTYEIKVSVLKSLHTPEFEKTYATRQSVWCSAYKEFNQRDNILKEAREKLLEKAYAELIQP